MRGLGYSDMIVAARWLIGLKEAAWDETMQDLLCSAHAADLYRKRLGRVHPLWGNGSLAARVRLQDQRWILPPEPFLSDRRFFAALCAVMDGVVQWRARV